MELVALATATPDWLNRQQSSSERSRAWKKVRFITLQLRPKWHRFQRNFLENVLNCLSANLSLRVGVSAKARRGCFSFSQRTRCFGSSLNWVCKELNLSLRTGVRSLNQRFLFFQRCLGEKITNSSWYMHWWSKLILFFFTCWPSTTPTHRYFVLISPVLLASGNQDGSQKNWGLWTVYRSVPHGSVC